MSWLFCIENFLCSVNFWCMLGSLCGGLNEVHSISVHWGQTHFSIFWHAKLSLALNEPI